jgi:prepilin-type N-terminal cleavage/methylation domain-containing protein/prepilin-type processing-associated H-X9-DG protein
MVSWRRAYQLKAFTLIELLLSIAIIAVLAALLMSATSQMNAYAGRAKSISNLRQIGVAARLYANDHNQQLPGQPAAQDPPSDPRVFLDSSDPNTTQLPLQQVISNQANNTAFIYNGFDDLGTDNQPPQEVSLTRLDQPSEVALMGLKLAGSNSFYVDLLFQPIALLPSLLNTSAFDGGSHYLFADGSVRFLTQAQYTNSLWLVNKTLQLPVPPLP